MITSAEWADCVEDRKRPEPTHVSHVGFEGRGTDGRRSFPIPRSPFRKDANVKTNQCCVEMGVRIASSSQGHAIRDESRF